jgi:hypothetical protein
MASWNVIAESTLDAAGYATITIGSIPSSYDHLYLTFSSRNGYSAYYQYLKYEFNGDNSFDYAYVNLFANSATPSSGAEGSSDGIRGIQGDYCASNSITADSFSTNTLWIPNYANTSHFTTTIHTSSVPNNSSSDSQWYTGITAGLYEDTAAISQILLKPGALGGEFMQYTTYTLYGINGA